jgi:hypothetical protein
MTKAFITVSIGVLFHFLLSHSLWAANIYVDNTLSSDCTSGNYSITNRDCSGSGGNAYNTIQEAVDVVTAGDTIYMRGGTYNEHISIPNGKQGSEDAWITLTSYPKEWAKIDPGHDIGSGYGAYVIRYKAGGHRSCPAYWIFSNFEVTGGGPATNTGDGGGILLDTGHHIIFQYLYIHDNHAGPSNNPAGIALFTDGQAPQYCIIRYCVIKDNACTGTDNCANINIMTSYAQQPGSTSISNAVHHNQVYYNLIEGSFVGLKYKGPNECLTLDNTGSNMAYQDYGDEIHHNIFLNFHDEGLIARQDFIQVHNNIFESPYTQYGVTFGSSHNGRVEDWRGTRKPVSSPRLVKRSMQISRTTLTLLTSSEGLWDLSNWQRFQAL